MKDEVGGGSNEMEGRLMHEIRCHDNDLHARAWAGEIKWLPPAEPEREPYGYPFRTCSWCGSIHPKDLMGFANDPANTIEGHFADWKYGWPHKVYIDGVPNPQAGRRPMYRDAAPSTTPAKFYTIHMKDTHVVGDSVTSDELSDFVAGLTGLRVVFTDDGNVCWEPVSSRRSRGQWRVE